jgi:hypothetical protein
MPQGWQGNLTPSPSLARRGEPELPPPTPKGVGCRALADAVDLLAAVGVGVGEAADVGVVD